MFFEVRLSLSLIVKNSAKNRERNWWLFFSRFCFVFFQKSLEYPLAISNFDMKTVVNHSSTIVRHCTRIILERKKSDPVVRPAASL